MKTINLNVLGKGITSTLSKHAPEILMGLGIGGMCLGTVLAVKDTPKAVKLIEQKKAEQEVDKLKPTEVISTTWKCYIPAAVAEGVGIACLVASGNINHRHNMALATSAALAETALKEYTSKVKEVIGEDKEREVRDAVAKEQLEKAPKDQKPIVVNANGSADTLCYDPITGRKFKTNIDHLNKTVNEFNRRMVAYDGYCSLNDFYDLLGLETVQCGDDLGWRAMDGCVELDPIAKLDENLTPYLVMSFTNPPTYGFNTY